MSGRAWEHFNLHLNIREILEIDGIFIDYFEHKRGHAAISKIFGRLWFFMVAAIVPKLYLQKR